MRHGPSFDTRICGLLYFAGALLVFLILLTSCSPKRTPLLDPARFSIQQIHTANHYLRLQSPEELVSALEALGCAKTRCDIGDAGQVSIIRFQQNTIVAQANPHLPLKDLMKRCGCGSRFICATDGKSVSILGAAQ